MRPRAVALLVLALCGPRATARGADGVAYGLRLEGGAEQDSNPARLEQVEGADTPAVDAATALRLVAGGELTAASARGHRLSLAVEGAGRRFVQRQAQGEDMLVLDARGAGELALAARTRLAVAAHHYDVFQRARRLPDARDFRSTAPSLRFEQGLGPARVGLGGGWRWFTFKPERAFDFSGPSVFLDYRQAWAPALGEEGAEWDWGAAAAFEGRRFASIRCPSPSSPCPALPPGPTRTDSFFSLALNANRTGDALLGAGAALQLNDSNSYGESLVRLAVHLRAVVLLPWQLSLAGRAELVGSRYADAVPVGQRMDSMAVSYVSIEEEGRSTLRLELARPLGRWAEAGVRYSLWANALGGGPVSYLRQTGLLFVALAWGS
jgi:hypothetical protein